MPCGRCQPLCLDRCQERLYANDIHDAREIISEYVQGHLGRNLRQAQSACPAVNYRVLIIHNTNTSLSIQTRPDISEASMEKVRLVRTAIGFLGLYSAQSGYAADA